MKKLVLALFILLLAVGGGAWWLLRGSSSLSSLEEGPSGFTSESQGVGRLLRFQEGGTPLRTFQWVRPNEGGVVVAQILTQTDHQQIALFKDGQIMARMHVPRPDGISEGFYRFAQLRDALVVPGNAVVLLYRAQDATAADVPVILDHLGRAPEGTPADQAELMKLGRLRQIYMKYSNVKADAKPMVRRAWDAFGPDRVVFGGDWPVCLLGATYQEWVTMLRQILASRPAVEQSKLWSRNALRHYTLRA